MKEQQLPSKSQFDPTRKHTQPLGAEVRLASSQALGLFSEKTKDT